MLVTLVRAHNPGPYTGEGNNTYLVGGPEAILIDAGTGDPRHLDEVTDALAQHRATLAAIVVTHGHTDHASGAEALAQRWPSARFFKMPWTERDARYQVPWTPLADGDQIAIGDDTLESLHTPGHAPDHLAFHHKRTGTVFVGDLVTLHGTVVIPASRGGSLPHYMASLRRIVALNALRLLPAHGPAIEDPQTVLERYIRHREQREEQILAAVHAGHRTLESIVDNVYDGLAEALKGAARETVLAHLTKLADDGAVTREDDGWRAR